MFNTRKTKIVSAPAEEVLEVEASVEPPKAQQVANIEFLAVKGNEDDLSYGTLTDYNGVVYYYEWDTKSKRIMRLESETIDALAWNLCDDVLHKYYVKTIKEEPIVPQIEQIVKKALEPVANAFRSMDNKINNLPNTRAASLQYQMQPTARPTTIQQSAPADMDTPAIEVADGEISANAMRFLEQATGPDLGIDYMSL